MKLDILDVFIQYLRRKKITFSIVGGFLILGIVLVFVLPKRYTATVKILPPTQQGGFMGLSAQTVSILQGLGISGITGVNIVDLYADILRSKNVRRRVVERCGLVDKLGVESTGKALSILSRISRFKQNMVGVFTIEVEYTDPEIAACIANAYAEELDRFLKEQTMSQGRSLRIFLEKRLEDVKKELKVKEDSLISFQKKHGVPLIFPEDMSTVSSFVELASEVFKKELQLAYLKKYFSSGNPQLSILEKEIESMRSKLKQLLPVTSTYLRLFAEYKVTQEVYIFLTQQYEQAKIMEVKDTPVISILERPSVPKVPSFPKKKIFVATFLFVGIVLSFFYTIVAVMLENIRKNPSENKKIIEFQRELKSLFWIKKK